MLNNENIDPSWLTLAPTSSSSSSGYLLPIESTLLTPSTNLMLKHDHENIDPSWLTLAQPSSSPSPPNLLPVERTPLTISQPLPPCPAPFEFTLLPTPARTIHSQSFFFSEIFLPSISRHSQSDSDIIPQEKDPHQEKQELGHVSLPNLITNTSTNKVYGQRQSNLQSSRPVKRRRVNRDTVPPPFPWATSKRATVYSLDHLVSELKLKTISGTLQCKFCMFQQNDVQIDLVENFGKLTKFMEENIHNMRERAPDTWINPVLPKCDSCGKEKAMQPLITKKRNINWLFLLLSQLIGCCNLAQLKYFCKHSDIHRTGAKDRLIFSTYLGLCKQLQPNRPFYH